MCVCVYTHTHTEGIFYSRPQNSYSVANPPCGVWFSLVMPTVTNTHEPSVQDSFMRVARATHVSCEPSGMIIDGLVVISIFMSL